MVTAVKHQIMNVSVAGKNSIFSRKNDRPIWLNFDYSMEVHYMAAVVHEFLNLQGDFVHEQHWACMYTAK